MSPALHPPERPFHTHTPKPGFGGRGHDYSRAVYDNPYIAVADKVRFLKAEVLEVMLYGCVTWTLSPGDFDKLREVHRGLLLRCLNAYTLTRAAPDYNMLSFFEVLLRTDCECIEATVIKRIFHYAGRVARMHDDRLPNIVMRGEMVGGKRKRGQPAKRLEHRVTEYCTAFGINSKCWMRAAQDAPEWYRKVERGAEVFMSAWSTKGVNEINARPRKITFRCFAVCGLSSHDVDLNAVEEWRVIFRVVAILVLSGLNA